MAYGYLTVGGGWTIECWILRNGAPASGESEAIFVQSTQADADWGTTGLDKGRQLWFGLNTAGIYVSIIDYNGIQRIGAADPSGSTVTDNSWHHVALTLLTDAKTVKLYVDGQSVATFNSSTEILWDPGTASIGGNWQPKFGAYGSYAWNGGLAYLAMSNIALSGNRIAEHYAAGNGGAVYYGDNEVTRMNRILDWSNTPEQARTLDSALVTMQGVDVTGNNALDKLQDTAEAASGYVFADGTSHIVYHNRRRRYNKLSDFTFAESQETAVEVDLEYEASDDWIFNDIRGDRPFGTTVRMMDQESVDIYGRRVMKITIPVTSHEVMRNAVSWLLSIYKEDHIRISNVSIEVTTATDTAVLAGTGKLQIGDRITLAELPEHAPVTSIDAVIENISINADFTNKRWITTFALSPSINDDIFEIGTSSLGSGDRLAY